MLLGWSAMGFLVVHLVGRVRGSATSRPASSSRFLKDPRTEENSFPVTVGCDRGTLPAKGPNHLPSSCRLPRRGETGLFHARQFTL